MSTSNVSRPAEPQRPAQPPAQGKAPSEKPAETDLFASLLSLVSDTHLATDAATPLAEPAAADAQDAPDQNPLAALLAWTAPTAVTAPTPAAPVTASAAPQGGTVDAALPTTATTATDKPQAGGIDISGMTPVVDEKLTTSLPSPEPTAPASAARPAFATAAARPAFASRAEAPAQNGTPAMVWQRGTVSSTDALQQQFASQSIQQAQNAPAGGSLAHVRSTVALDERFALASASAWQAGVSREAAGIDGALPASPGLRAAAQEGMPGMGSLIASGGSATGDSLGGSSGDGRPGEQTGSAPDGSPVDREAEGPTVSHWGTQHLRHASLRVGGESGADAIDIQLSMKGQEVQVAFQSDNAEARASLREGASEALADMLQRSGIQLGHVSVGSQGQQNGHPTQHTPTVHRGEMAGRNEATAEAPAPSAPRPRADGSRPLDLFV